MNMNRFESHISEIKRKQNLTGMEPLERYLIDSNEIMVPIMMPSRSSAAPSTLRANQDFTKTVQFQNQRSFVAQIWQRVMKWETKIIFTKNHFWGSHDHFGIRNTIFSEIHISDPKKLFFSEKNIRKSQQIIFLNIRKHF